MWFFKRKGPSGFSYFSTAEEVTDGIDGSHLTAIVTGASSGIGAETARVLALRGVHVVMGIRNVAAGNEVKEAIIKEIPAAKVDVMELDLSSLASVKKGQYNNAGIFATPFKLSKDNIELQFATNHLGHFLLTNLLLDTMKKTAQKTKKEGRIVNVSSDAHRFLSSEGIRFDRINDQEGYNRLSACSPSKLADILHSNELARRLKSASTTCYVALHPQVKGISGEYFYDNNIGKASSMARDADLARRLWDFSTNLVNSKIDDS